MKEWSKEWVGNAAICQSNFVGVDEFSFVK